jgi:hypothetical protein
MLTIITEIPRRQLVSALTSRENPSVLYFELATDFSVSRSRVPH